VRDALEKDFMLTDAEDFKAKDNEAGYAKMAADLGADAVIVGKVERQRVVLVVRGSDGAVVKEIVLKGARGARMKTTVQEAVPPAVATALGPVAEPEPEPEPEPAEEEPSPEAGSEDTGEEEPTEDSESEPSEDDPDAAPTPPGLIVTAGPRFINRALKFNDALTQVSNPAYAMRDYELGLGPAVAVRAQLYPGALFGAEGFGANVGLVGAFEQGIPINSTYAGSLPGVPRELKNSMQEWYVGPRIRFPGDGNVLGVALTYGQHKFVLEGDEAVPIVPDVKYTYLRLSTDAEFSFGAVFVGAELGVRLVLDSGDLETDLWFPNASGKGIDLGVHLGYQLLDSIALVGGVNAARYGFDFNPIKTTATRVAGGATDQFLSGFVGIRLALGGSGGASASDDSASVSAEAEAEAEASTDEAESAEDEPSGDEEADSGEE